MKRGRMKARVVPMLVGALAMGLIVVVGGAAAGLRIPDHSIGLKKLTPHLAKLIREGGKDGQQGPQGLTGQTGSAGATGSMGATGPEGKVSFGRLLTYSVVPAAPPSELITPPQAVDLTREDGTNQESIGPLTFHASCESEGEDTIRGKLEVTSDENGVFLNGKPLNAGITKTLQELAISGGGSEESFPTVVRATNEAGTFAMQGVASILVGIPGGCHFFGSLIEDS